MGGGSVDHGAIVPSNSICLAPMLHIRIFIFFPCLSFPSLSHSAFLSSLLNLPGLLSFVTSAPTYGESLCTPYKSHGATNMNGKHFIERESFEWRRTNSVIPEKFHIRSNCEFLSGLYHFNGSFLGLCLPKIAFAEGKASYHQEDIVDLIWTEFQTPWLLLTISGCFSVRLTLLTFPPKGTLVSHTSWTHPLIFLPFLTLCLDPFFLFWGYPQSLFLTLVGHTKTLPLCFTMLLGKA